MPIDAIQAIGVDATLDIAHVLQIMAKVIYPALAEHDVVVQILAQAFPQLHRFFIQVCGFIPQVIRAHDRSVTARVTAADPAFFQHRDIGDAVLPGEVVSSRKPVTTATDDQYVIFRLRFWTTPRGSPVFMVTDRVS